MEINIYDIKGRSVKKLVDKVMEGGEHEVIWNGTNEVNQYCSSGIYLMNLKLDGVNRKTGKLMIMK